MRHFLLMAINDVNDIPNAPMATSLSPRSPDENCRYREIVELFIGIQERGGVELSIAEFDVDDADPLPIERVGGGDVLQAAKDGYVFRTSGETATLQKRERSVVLKFNLSELHAPDVVRVIALLGLRPGQVMYKVRSEQSVEEPDDPLPEAFGNGTIAVNMRSILDIMAFLSKGVCVPTDHIAQGIAPVTPGYDGSVYDWTAVTADLISIRSQKHRPRHADLAVPYRGHWYYIERDDVTSRTTLTLLELLLELQEIEQEQRAPLLTLPL